MSHNLSICTGVALLLLTIIGTACDQSLSHAIQKGEDIFAVDRGHVLEVSYRSVAQRMLAYRWGVRDKFVIFFARKDDPRPHFCLAGKGFEIVLRQLTSLKLQRAIDEKSVEEYLHANPISTWRELVIRDDSEIEPFQAMILPLKGSSTEVLVRIGNSTYVVGIEHRVFELISSGCKSLAPN